MNKEIGELFEKLLQEKTFTIDALEGIKDLKRKAEAVESQNILLTKELDQTKVLYGNTCTDNANLRTENKKLLERLGSIEARELKVAIQDVQLQCEKDKQALVLSMFNTVFKPSSIRESAWRSGPLVIPGCDGNQYSPGQPGRVEAQHQSSETIERSKE